MLTTLQPNIATQIPTSKTTNTVVLNLSSTVAVSMCNSQDFGGNFSILQIPPNGIYTAKSGNPVWLMSSAETQVWSEETDSSTYALGTITIGPDSVVSIAAGAVVNIASGSSINIGGGQLTDTNGNPIQPTVQSVPKASLGFGEQGSLSFTANATLAYPIRVTSLSVSAGVIIQTAGFTIQCTGTITGGVTGNPASLYNLGLPGAAGNSVTSGVGGSGAPGGASLGPGGNGGMGLVSSDVAQNGANAPGSLLGGIGGNGAAYDPSSFPPTYGGGSDQERSFITDASQLSVVTLAGGGGGGGGNYAYSGGGGGGGGVVLVLCQTVVGYWVIDVSGGSGGDYYSGSTNAVGGGGGAGGLVLVYYEEYGLGGLIQVDIAGGTGGTSGSRATIQAQPGGIGQYSISVTDFQ